jgi:hypothetical protein
MRSLGIGNRYHLTSVENVTSAEKVTSDNSDTKPVPKVSPELVTKPAHIRDVLKRGLEKKVAVEVPDALRTPAFETAWTEWQEHRRQLGKKFTPLAAKKQLAVLAQIGVRRAVEAINHSITNGYTGIFEPRTNEGSKTNANINRNSNTFNANKADAYANAAR